MSFLVSIHRLGFAILSLLALGAACGLSAQTDPSGVLVGVVSNSAIRASLEGAIVAVPALGRQVRSDNTGRYAIGNLPAGEHTVVVTYTGLDEAKAVVSIGAGQTVSRNFDLTADVYRLEAFTVAGEREGNAVSITRQRNAENLTNVVAVDLYGNVADNNIGNFLKRLPGVAGVGEGGDITGLSIRGAPRSWNAINVDGVLSSAAYSGTDGNVGRSIVTDQLPSEFIKEVELVKGLRPDMAADSVGGAVNLVTKSALDIRGTRFTWRLGGTYNAYRPEIREFRPAGAFTYMTRLGEKENVGLAVTGSYGEVRNARDRVQMSIAANGVSNQARTLDDDYIRTRSSAAVKLNYRPSDRLELRTGFQYSYYSTQQERSDWNIQASSTSVADYNVVSRAQIAAGAVPRTTANQAAGIAPGYSDAYTEFLHANFTNTKGGLTRHARNYKAEIGGEFRLPENQKIVASFSANPSDYYFVLQTIAAARRGGFGVASDGTRNRSRRDYVQTYGTTIGSGANLDDYTAQLAVQDRYSKENVFNGLVDYTKQLTLGTVPVEFKAGANWRSQNRTLRVYTPTWNYVGADRVAGRNAATGANDDNLKQFLNREPGYGVFKNQYAQRDDFNFPSFQKFFEANPNQFTATASVAAKPVYNEITEKVTALYAMGTSQIGALTALAGARFESTDVSAVGPITDPRNATLTQIERGGDYRKVTPSVHLKYELRRGLLARASYSTGFTRPNFANLFPNTQVSYDTASGLGSVSQNDPALRPQTSRNYDVALEYYLEPAGVISAGYFQKRISDFIAREVSVIEGGAGNGFDGNYQGFDLVTTRNYGRANIKGYEINYSQQLRKLPRPFNSLTVNGNWTRIQSEGYYGNSASGDELVEFIPRTSNAGLSWKLGRFTIRAQYNYQGTFLNSYNADPEQRIYSTNNETWDGGALYDLNGKFSLYADVTNIFNKEPSWFRGRDRGRVVMSEVFGTRIAAGITGRF